LQSYVLWIQIVESLSSIMPYRQQCHCLSHTSQTHICDHRDGRPVTYYIEVWLGEAKLRVALDILNIIIVSIWWTRVLPFLLFKETGLSYAWSLKYECHHGLRRSSLHFNSPPDDAENQVQTYLQPVYYWTASLSPG
jgi:hypothetical protein